MFDDNFANFAAQHSASVKKRRIDQMIVETESPVFIDHHGFRNATRSWTREAIEHLDRILQVFVQFWTTYRRGDPIPAEMLTETSGDALRSWLFDMPKVNRLEEPYPEGDKYKKYFRPNMGDIVLEGIPVLDRGVSLKHYADPRVLELNGWTTDWFNLNFKRPRPDGKPVRDEWFNGHSPVSGKPDTMTKFHSYGYATGVVFVKVKHHKHVNGKWAGPDLSKPGSIELGIFAKNTVERYVGGMDRATGRRIMSNVPKSWVKGHAKAIAEAKTQHNEKRKARLQRKGAARNKAARRQTKKRLDQDIDPELDWIKSDKEMQVFKKAMELTVGELRQIAKEAGLSNYSKLRKTGLVKLLMTNGVV